MKDVKQVFRCLLICVLVTVFASSCQQVEEADLSAQENQEMPEYVLHKTLTLPLGFEEEEVSNDYLRSASEAMVAKLEDNFKVVNFLHKEGLLGQVKETMKHGDHYSDIDLASFLNRDQMSEFEHYIPVTESANERWCTTTTGWCYIRTCCGSLTQVYCWVRHGIC